MKKPFYGWVIVAVGILIGVTEAGTFQNIFSIFLKPMAEEFGWSRAMLTGAIAIGSLSGGLISPLIGPVLDTRGPRMVSFSGVLLLSVALMAMSSVKQVWEIYFFFGLGRMIAIGVLSLVITVAVSNWFILQRGRAMGIAWLGSRIGGIFLPPFVQFLILLYNWRLAWFVLGASVFFLSGLPSVVFLRRRPEDMGLLPDGRPSTQERDPKHQTLSSKGKASLDDSAFEPEWTVRRAKGTMAFWALTVINCFLLFAQAGINFHIFPFLTDHDLAESTSVFVLSVVAASAAASSLVWSCLSEKYETKKLLVAEFLGCGTIFFLLYFVVVRDFPGLRREDAIIVVYLTAALYGMFLGGMMPLFSIIWAEYFGRTSLGSIYGVVQPFRYAANAGGPLFGAFCFDYVGSYNLAFITFITLLLMSGLIACSMKEPSHAKHRNV